MYLLILLVILLHIYLFYKRQVLFYKVPTIDLPFSGTESMYSPAEGRVVYIRYLNKGTIITSNKESRKVEFDDVKTESEYIQIGIYMNPNNNHHVLSPIYTAGNYKEYGEKLLPMLSIIDNLLPFKSIVFKNWWDKSEFLKVNKRLFYTYDIDIENKLYMSIIFDKYVNKFKVIRRLKGNRFIEGFICRGSQVDLFIPTELLLNKKLKIKLNEKVNYETKIF